MATEISSGENDNDAVIGNNTNDDDDNDISIIASSTTPKAAHPTARAFFAALDSSEASSLQSESLKRKSQSLGWRNRHSQEQHYPVRVLDSKFTVEQVQRGEIDGTYGTGATVWPAAMVLVKYMEKHRSALIANRRVVDLGSGTGVTSIAAAILGASHVCCTDGEESVVGLAKRNIRHAATQLILAEAATKKEDEADGDEGGILPLPQDEEEDDEDEDDRADFDVCGCSIHVQKLWWGKDVLDDSITTATTTPEGNNASNADPYDVILVADCVLPKLYPIAPLVEVIDAMLAMKPASVAILSYEHRYFPDYHPREKFAELASQRGLDVTIVPPDDHDPIYCVEDIEIWQVCKAGR